VKFDALFDLLSSRAGSGYLSYLADAADKVCGALVLPNAAQARQAFMRHGVTAYSVQQLQDVRSYVGPLFFAEQAVRYIISAAMTREAALKEDLRAVHRDLQNQIRREQLQAQRVEMLVGAIREACLEEDSTVAEDLLDAAVSQALSLDSLPIR